MQNEKLNIVYVPVDSLIHAEYNPRRDDEDAIRPIVTSVDMYGVLDALIVNSAPNRKNIVIGGNARLEAAKKLGYTEIPVIFVNIPDLEKEKDLCLRLNKAVGEWDLELLAEFDESFLGDIGFTSEELDDIFPADENPEEFDLKAELKKLHITEITVQKGDVYNLNGSRLMCGDSTIEEDMLKLMNGEKANMVMTDPPYRLSYLSGKKRNGKPTEGFGLKRDRKYLETDILPPDFTELWTANIAKIANPNFSIICYENWKNIREIWNCIEKYWTVRNMIVWHLPNRVQGFSAKYKFFNKHDIAMVATSPNLEMPNLDPESDELLQTEYETALYASSGKPQWEGYEKGKKICPTDFVEFVAADEKSSGQGIIFGTKPLEILIPYIKVLTKRKDLVLEPFGGSGSTLIAATKLDRRCYIMEKSPVYTEVIKKRWENLTGLTARKIHEG